MAQLISLVMVIFVLTPAFAPLVGEQIMSVFGWRGIFLAFVVFGVVLLSWFFIRLEETLRSKKRRVFRLKQVLSSLEEMYLNKQIRLAICAQSLSYVTLFDSIILIQPIFDKSFGEGGSFAKSFALIAAVSAISSLINARLVTRFGMRTMVLLSLRSDCGLRLRSGLFFQASLDTAQSFVVYFIWQTGVFFQVGFTQGNLKALALQPMGHIAGFASSVTEGFSTAIVAILASVINQFFDGTPLPLIISCFLMAYLAWTITHHLPDDIPDNPKNQTMASN